METKYIDARFEEIEAKLMDLHRRLSLIETMYRDDIKDFLEEIKETEEAEMEEVREEEKKGNVGFKNKGGKEDGKSRQRARTEEE